jgi:hypothetical protein
MSGQYSRLPTRKTFRPVGWGESSKCSNGRTQRGARTHAGPVSRTPLRRSVTPAHARSVPWVSGPAVFWNVATLRRLQGEAGRPPPSIRPMSGWPQAEGTLVLDSARSDIRPAAGRERTNPPGFAVGVLRGRRARAVEARFLRRGLARPALTSLGPGKDSGVVARLGHVAGTGADPTSGCSAASVRRSARP